jgi:hypothetical protein
MLGHGNSNDGQYGFHAPYRWMTSLRTVSSGRRRCWVTFGLVVRTFVFSFDCIIKRGVNG